GKNAAREMLPELKKIAELQGYPGTTHKPVESGEYVLIRDLEIKGLETYNRSYIKGKIGVKPPQLANYQHIRDGIKALYSSGNFSKVYYRIKNNEKGEKTLYLFVKEKSTKQSVKFGLHYDDLFKTG